MIDRIHGPRLYLRATAEADYPAIQKWLTDPSHSKGYLGTDVDLTQWLENYESLAPDMSNAVLLSAITHDTGEFVAFVSAKPNYPLPWIWDAEILSDPHLAGRGFGREAFALGLRFVFEQDNAHKVAGPVAADNIASLNVVDSLGFVREGTLRSHLLRSDGSVEDAYLYGLLKSEWVDPFAPPAEVMST